MAREGTTDARIRVLLLLDQLSGGGAEGYAIGLATGLDRQRFAVAVCATRYGDDPDVVALLEKHGVELVRLGRGAGSKLDVRAWLPLWRYLRENRVDVVNSHKFGSNLWAALIAPLARVPVLIATEHTWSFTGDRRRILIDRHHTARRATAFVAVSEADRRSLVDVVGVPAAKTRVMPIAAMTPRPVPTRDRAAVRGELGLGTAFTVGTVAYLRPQKALDVLLRAFALFRATHPDARLVIVGDGPEEGRLRLLASELGIESALTLVGRRRDVPELLLAFDAFALSSDYEGTPLVIHEAALAGCPIVSTNVGGIAEVVPDEECALLVPPQDPAALAAALERVADDPEQARTRAAAAREGVASTYTPGRVITLWSDLFEELVARSR